MDDIRTVLALHLHSDQLVDDLIELITPVVTSKCCSAAKAMRDRCSGVAAEIQEGAVTTPVADTAAHIRNQINRLPLESD